MWQKFHPAVPRHWLFAIAGVMWILVGALLCIRATIWLSPFTFNMDLLLEIAGIVLGAVGYVYLFSKAVERNINRIDGLPDWVCAFAFTAWRGYLMIGLMVMIGIVLRNSPVPKSYLSIPYTAMGAMLFIGGVRLLRQFVVIASQER